MAASSDGFVLTPGGLAAASYAAQQALDIAVTLALRAAAGRPESSSTMCGSSSYRGLLEARCGPWRSFHCERAAREPLPPGLAPSFWSPIRRPAVDRLKNC